jgi:hypothetical protein
MGHTENALVQTCAGQRPGGPKPWFELRAFANKFIFIKTYREVE